jgi:O-antigen/teichoic acid export membrane protein
LAVSVFLGSFKNIGIVYFQKDIEFHKQFIYQISGTVVDLVVSISIAILLKNVWALIFGFLAGNIVRLISSYILHPYKPKLNINWAQTKELFGFGRWIMGSSILIFLINQGDDIFIGKMLGVTSLGLYQLAYSLSNLPATEITHVISQVSFPAYSKLQSHEEKLKLAYLQVLQISTFLSVPIAFGIAFMANDFTKLFLGVHWLPMVPAMQVLALWGLIRSIGATTGPLFQAVGRPDISTKLQGLKVILLLILIYPFTVKWGILGTSFAVMLNSLIVNPIADYYAIKTIRCRTVEFVKMLAVPFFGAISVVLDQEQLYFKVSWQLTRRYFRYLKLIILESS